jgi:nitroimidazol reductase NimA-like FMN-containing flavoprotein (pyridoxamine 5'-phosphate oxidase superfamily)
MPGAPQQVLDYLASEKTLTLATASLDGTPHASTFMYANDGLTIYFYARPSSATAEHLRVNKRVSFAIDEYVPDWNKAKGIQGQGECTPVEGDDVAKALVLLGDKYPSPRTSASTANIAFFKIDPHELQYIDNEGTDVHLSGDDFGVAFHREQVL